MSFSRQLTVLVLTTESSGGNQLHWHWTKRRYTKDTETNHETNKLAPAEKNTCNKHTKTPRPKPTGPTTPVRITCAAMLCHKEYWISTSERQGTTIHAVHDNRAASYSNIYSNYIQRQKFATHIHCTVHWSLHKATSRNTSAFITFQTTCSDNRVN